MKLYWSRCCGQMGASGQTGRGKEARKNHAGNDHCSHCNSAGRRRHCRRAALRCGELSHSSPGVPPGQRRKKVEHNKAVVTPVTPVPAALSSDASEWIEIAQDVFFCKKTGELKDRDHKVFLARNRLRAFICFWEAPDHTVSYPVFCNDVLGRPLSEDESTEENRQLNRAIKKSMTQTIMRLREDLMTFPELSIENASGLSYRLNIGTVRESNVGLSECESDVL